MPGTIIQIFWNWPPLSEEFFDQVSKRLGHRIIRVAGVLTTEP
jgi:hypothetical protein